MEQIMIIMKQTSLLLLQQNQEEKTFPVPTKLVQESNRLYIIKQIMFLMEQMLCHLCWNGEWSDDAMQESF